MKSKYTITLSLIVVSLIFSGCKSVEPTVSSVPTPTVMSETEAKAIAEASCIKGGEALGPGTYNENSQTWWFDANLNATKPGCNPACVVSATTKTAEINWRCTGLVVPTENVSDTITKLFQSKYPKYAETLSITIREQDAEHARGMVDFVQGEAGGIYLAAKVNSEWQIVFDGNGSIPCTLNQYNFPASMLSDCAK